MNEDQDRTRLGHGPETLAVLRHMALNATQAEPSKGFLRGKLNAAQRPEPIWAKAVAGIPEPAPQR